MVRYAYIAHIFICGTPPLCVCYMLCTIEYMLCQSVGTLIYTHDSRLTTMSAQRSEDVFFGDTTTTTSIYRYCAQCALLSDDDDDNGPHDQRIYTCGTSTIPYRRERSSAGFCWRELLSWQHAIEAYPNGQLQRSDAKYARVSSVIFENDEPFPVT